jgi:hypothetical protein
MNVLFFTSVNLGRERRVGLYEGTLSSSLLSWWHYFPFSSECSLQHTFPTDVCRVRFLYYQFLSPIFFTSLFPPHIQTITTTNQQTRYKVSLIFTWYYSFLCLDHNLCLFQFSPDFRFYNVRVRDIS